jgi:CheY-like chemotaxis protein
MRLLWFIDPFYGQYDYVLGVFFQINQIGQTKTKSIIKFEYYFQQKTLKKHTNRKMTFITTILIVDDDVEDQELLKEAIKEVDESVKCISAKNGEDALELLHTFLHKLPQLIFLDLNMPRMNGKVFLSKLKQLEVLKEIPIIIYTTSKSQTDVEETRKLGALQFITKPNSFEEIVQVATDLLIQKEI